MKAMLLVLSFLLFSTCAFSDYESAREAYNRKDYATALKEVRPSADQGDAKSQFLLGWLYDYGYGVIEDDLTAMKLYTLAANQGEGAAQYHLGWMNENGNGVDQNYKAALKWYGLAANQGHIRAQFKLGWLHEQGNGADQNYEVASKWYRLAAEQGYSSAQNNLGNLYANGRGVPQDLILSHMWWDIAAAQRADKAAQNLYFLRKKMTPADISRAEELARECTAKKYKSCYQEKPVAGSLAEGVLVSEGRTRGQIGAEVGLYRTGRVGEITSTSLQIGTTTYVLSESTALCDSVGTAIGTDGFDVGELVTVATFGERPDHAVIVHKGGIQMNFSIVVLPVCKPGR